MNLRHVVLTIVDRDDRRLRCCVVGKDCATREGEKPAGDIRNADPDFYRGLQNI